MNNTDILSTIHTLVITTICPNCSSIAYDTNLKEYGMDSINCINLLVEIEDYYGFEFADEDLVFENFASIAAIADFVFKKIDKGYGGYH